MKRIDALSPRLDVRDLQVVLALASAGSTAGAAGVLHLTQSAVSRALRLAEDKLGERLFERTARGISPTAAGRRLVAGAAPVLAQLVALERDVVAGDAPLVVRVVCECYTAYRWLPSTMAALQRRSPRLTIALAVEHTRDPVAALRSGDVDVALLTTGSTRGASDRIHEAPLFTDEIVFVVGAGHPLATRRTISVADLTAHPLISTPAPPDEARWFAGAVFGRRRPGVTPLVFPLTEAVIDAARAGMGIAVMSEWIASTYVGQGDLVVKRLASGPLRRPWRIAWRHDVEDAARWLAAALDGVAPRVDVRRSA